MLDQYRQDLNSDNDHLGEGRQNGRRKVVFTLAGAALALLFFLFLIGAFRSEEEVTSEKETTTAVASELGDLQARVERLEQQLLGTNAAPNRPATQEIAAPEASDNPLKQLIASTATADDQIINEPDMAEPAQTYTPPVEQAAPPAPVKAQPKTYVIQKGDTLSKISQKFYGTTKKWKSIYDANRDKINNINNLKVGTTIVIPDSQ
ncbi:MAG: LysM peptidoglycan-binding domain-containing protein [Verrucomicrobia bacterium]|nr:LysM peptidoglycan-binding domain-containing protein [Verrucomicrobiota bacterium]MBS0637593.1 LysM peptidoglycan-binding domain-containing protein [Verrucomicrobiota bacterium]